MAVKLSRECLPKIFSQFLCNWVQILEKDADKAAILIVQTTKIGVKAS